MTWCFRLRFHLSESKPLGHQERERMLFDASRQPVALTSGEAKKSLANIRVLTLGGSGYDTEDHAAAAGQQWRNWLALALASLNAGADFGDRAPASGWASIGANLEATRASSRTCTA